MPERAEGVFNFSLIAVLLLASNPSAGMRSSTMYSMPRSWQNRRFSSLDPSAFTTNRSGFSASTVGMKSITPSPWLMKASVT